MRTVALATALVLLCVATAYGLGTVEDDLVTLTGTIGVYGNEPHTFLALAVEDVESGNTTLFRIDGPHLTTLRELQNSRVTISGTVTAEAAGPGLPAVILVREFEVNG